MFAIFLMMAITGHLQAQENVSCGQLQLYAKVKLAGAFVYDYANGASEGYYKQYVGKDTALIRQIHENQFIASAKVNELDTLEAIILRLFSEKRLRYKAEPKMLARIDKLSSYVNEMLSMEPDSSDCKKPITDAFASWELSYVNDKSYPGAMLQQRRSAATLQSLTAQISGITPKSDIPQKKASDQAPEPRGNMMIYLAVVAVVAIILGIIWSFRGKTSQKPAPSQNHYTPPPPVTVPPLVPIAKPIVQEPIVETKIVAKEVVVTSPLQEAEAVVPPISIEPPPMPPQEKTVSAPSAPPMLYLPKPLGDQFLARATQGEGSRFILDPSNGHFDLIHTEENYLWIRRSFGDILSDKAVTVTEGYGNLQFSSITTLTPGQAVPDGEFWTVAKKLVVKIE